MSIALKYALAPDVPDPHRRKDKDPGRRGARSKGRPSCPAIQHGDITGVQVEAMTKVETCTPPNASNIWSTYKTFQGVKIFKDAVNAKKAELTKNAGIMDTLTKIEDTIVLSDLVNKTNLDHATRRFVRMIEDGDVNPLDTIVKMHAVGKLVEGVTKNIMVKDAVRARTGALRHEDREATA